MSIRLMTLVWDIRWPTQNHLLVMLKLADHANDEGAKVWPAVATIAEQAQCSERTVQNVLRAFRTCGLVNVVKQGGGASPTIYSLNVPLIGALARSNVKLEGGADVIEIPENVFEQLQPTGATIAPLPVAPVQSFCTPTGATEGGRGAKLLHPNHQYNHQEKPSGAEARACDVDASASPRGRACFTVRAGDAPWKAWLGKLEPAEREAAITAGQLVASSRWPENGSLISIPKPLRQLSETSKRMSGDAA